jgi:fumarate reductase flavoprotein subunit
MRILPTKGPLAKAMGRLAPLVPKFVVNAMIKRLVVTWQHPENALFDDGAILVNARGERFTNEKVGPAREIAIAAQPDKICYFVLDERLIRRYSAWPHFISTAPKIAYAYAADYLRLRPDVAVLAGSLAALGRHRGLPQDALAEAVERFNRYASGSAPDPLGRTGDTEPLGGEQWVLLGPAKAYFTTTEGGAAVNEKMQVLDESGQPIDGLYAAGQTGLGGMVLWGHGLHIAWALTSGRLAGRSLMEGAEGRLRSEVT